MPRGAGRLAERKTVLAQRLLQFLPFGVVGLVPFPLEEVGECGGERVPCRVLVVR